MITKDNTRKASFNQEALHHILMVITQAKQCECQGKIVIASYGQDSQTGQDIPPKVKHISFNDSPETIANTIASLLQDQHRNIYMPLCVMREDLPAGKKGSEKDIVAVLGLVADFDDDEAEQWADRLPLPPSYVLETSQGRYQAAYLFKEPVSTEDAKPVAAILQKYSRCDFGTKDLSHIWRIDETLNWPNEKKVKGGRSPEAQQVKMIKPFDGNLIDFWELNGELEAWAADQGEQEQPENIFNQNNHSHEKKKEATKNQQKSNHNVNDDIEFLQQVAFKSQKHGEKIKALWNGDTSEHGGDLNRADQALCSWLAFYLQKDFQRIDYVFRQSKLMRQKWDEVHYSNGSTYGHESIRKAIAGQKNTYDPNYKESGSSSTPEEWETPISLDCQTAESVPDDLLPGVLGEMAIEISKASETPIELSTALLLTVVATACHGKFKIESVPGAHIEPVNIWFIVVLDPGNRKSFVLKVCMYPLNAWEKAQRVAMEESIKSAQSKRARQEVRLKTLRTQYGKAKKEDLAGIEADIIELESNLEEIPEPPQLWTQDATAEHSATLASHNNERMSALSAEGGILENLAGRYSNGVSNLDFYLQGHAGDPVRVDRGSREPVHLDNPCVTLGLAVQEDVLKGLSSKQGFKGRGFNDRILYFVPKSNLGYRTLEPVPINREVSERYSNLIERLLNIKEPPEHEGKKQPYILKPSREAYKEWHSFSKRIESKMRKGEELSEHTGWASKLPGAAARIAALLHCSIHVEDSINIPVELDTMKRALHLSAILTKHALIAFDKMGEDGGLNQARKLWGWIEKNQKKEFKKKDCFDALRGSFPRVADLDEPLKILQERNYILEETKKTGGRPSKIIRVNPELTKGW